MLNLSDRNWKEFFIEDIFSISSGKRLTKADMDTGNIPFIGSTDSNNGITNWIATSNSSFDKNVLGVNYNGSVVENFYHAYGCVFSDDVKRLHLRNYADNKFILLFFKTIILQQKRKYTYGYKFNAQRMARQKILIPVTIDGSPDYAFMEQYIKEREKLLVEKYIKYIDEIVYPENTFGEYDSVEWKEFYLTEVFTTITRGKRLKREDQIAGDVPYVSSSALNNGVDNFVSNSIKVRIFSDCISIANSGSVGTAFYQPFPFVASDHVTHLKNKALNQYHYLFIASILNRLSEKYNFNREINDNRISRERIMLPVDEHGNPNFAFMEQYMQRLEYELLQRYLAYLNAKHSLV